MGRRQRGWLAGLVGVLGMAAWGVGGATSASAARVPPSPSAFALNVVRLVVANNYVGAWRMLVSVEQASVPRALYVACEAQAPIPGRLAYAGVIGLQRTQIDVPGRSRPLSGYEVTVQTTIALPRGKLVTTQMLVPLVSDAGRLAWILHPERFDAYRHGHCLQHPPPA
jgi:hypothetical protein